MGGVRSECDDHDFWRDVGGPEWHLRRQPLPLQQDVGLVQSNTFYQFRYQRVGGTVRAAVRGRGPQIARVIRLEMFTIGCSNF